MNVPIKYASFVKQLNNYGFNNISLKLKKTGQTVLSGEDHFQHDNFRRDRKNMCANIKPKPKKLAEQEEYKIENTRLTVENIRLADEVKRLKEQIKKMEAGFEAAYPPQVQPAAAGQPQPVRNTPTADAPPSNQAATAIGPLRKRKAANAAALYAFPWANHHGTVVDEQELQGRHRKIIKDAFESSETCDGSREEAAAALSLQQLSDVSSEKLSLKNENMAVKLRNITPSLGTDLTPLAPTWHQRFNPPPENWGEHVRGQNFESIRDIRRNTPMEYQCYSPFFYPHIFETHPCYQRDYHESPQTGAQPRDHKKLSEEITSDRQRDCLILILHYLQMFRYNETATHLQRETGQFLNEFECADNMDFAQIVRGYEEYYENKHGRKPRFSRRRGGIDETSGVTLKSDQSKRTITE
uniref:HSF-type DNA-binding domain-containing protein n=1 Tax=Ditylum brightwellii TaxID=49249 RepID=A0A6U3R9V0_9STRA|mmetsp:Transcript_27051/g.40183  ORF Transcript_27051/g.40183 Transcript_27051/m.40183 type:complete len:412 (+) Transcript_27051:263-1498(+)